MTALCTSVKASDVSTYLNILLERKSSHPQLIFQVFAENSNSDENIFLLSSIDLLLFIILSRNKPEAIETAGTELF